MKKLILLLLPLLFVPFFVNARSIADLKFLIDDCPDYPEALGCVYYETKTIYISPKVIPVALPFVLTHEIGHYFMEETTYQEYQNVFGQGTLYELKELIRQSRLIKRLL